MKFSLSIKKIPINRSLLTIIIILSSYFTNVLVAQQGHFKIRNDEYMQIGYNSYKTLSFGMGGSLSTPNNGHWSLEHWNGGFNIFKPWPEYNWGNYKFFIKDYDGWVGIGKYPVHKLDVNGNIGVFGTLAVTSDERLKTNVSNLNSSNCLSKIMQIQSISYNYKYDRFPYQGPTPEGEQTEIKQKTIQPYKEDNGEQQAKILRHGFSAQDLKKILPEIVLQDEAGFLSVDYIAIIPILVEAMKEQQTKIQVLEQQIANLKKD